MICKFVTKMHIMGKFMYQIGVFLKNKMCQSTAEALAIRRALSLVQDEGFNKIILASDCLSVIQRIRASAMDRTGRDEIGAETFRLFRGKTETE
jgi:hypothetical protein